MSKAREQRIAARTNRKAAKESAQSARKAARVENKALKIANRQERAMNKQDNNLQKRLSKNVRVAEVKEKSENLPADMTGEQMPLQAKVKATNYLKRRKRVIEDENDGDMLGAQFLEERNREIAERHDEIETAIDDTQGLTEDEQDELIPEYEDVHEMIMEEEANNFSFDGNEDNFVDPDTAAMLINVGKKAAEKYKEKRFAAGKKAFGRTAADDKAAKEKKALGEKGAIGSASDAAIAEITRIKTQETVKEYTPYIIGGAVLLVIVGVAVFYAGKKA